MRTLTNFTRHPLKEEPEESVEEEEAIWLDDYLRREGIQPPFDHRMMAEERREILKQRKTSSNMAMDRMKRSEQMKRKRRVKRSGYFYASNCPPGVDFSSVRNQSVRDDQYSMWEVSRKKVYDETLQFFMKVSIEPCKKLVLVIEAHF